MATRDPEAKKRQLLEAALEEFAAHGFAGTRTDAISERAGCSTGLIYTYFGSKEGLFDAVFGFIAAETMAAVPFTPEDLPGYAARLFDAQVAQPKVMRVVAWYQLERAARPPEPADLTQKKAEAPDATREKIAAMEAALARGAVTSSLDAAQLVLLTQAIASAWGWLPDAVTSPVAAEDDLTRRRETVRNAVALLVAGPSRA
jgi:AcrR family transcriptional regulator